MQIIRCPHCGEPEYLMTRETKTITSRCICEAKRIKCDECCELFLRRDISFTNLYLSLCKKCNHDMCELDQVVKQDNPISNQSDQTMLCVENYNERLQLTIRASMIGMLIIFPFMTKKQIRPDQAQMIIDALNGNSILLREHSYEKNRLYADLFINYEKLTFISRKSKRMIIIEKTKENIYMTIELGGNGSSLAAEVLRTANRYNPNNNVLFHTVDQEKYHAKHLG